MSRIEIKNLSVTFYHKKAKEYHLALDRVSLTVESGEFVAIVGPSGCGKTTILRSLAGLISDYEGEVLIDGRDALDVSVAERNIAYVFQEQVLYPTMTIFDNIAFPLRLAKLPLEEVNRRVLEVAHLLEIEYLLTRKPRHLSGGQQQTVSLARAVVKHPDIYLLDEPFSNLDPVHRTSFRHLLKKLQRELKGTFILTTHELTDAFALADKLVIMDFAKIEQIGSPKSLFENPQNDYVREILNLTKEDSL